MARAMAATRAARHTVFPGDMKRWLREQRSGVACGSRLVYFSFL